MPMSPEKFWAKVQIGDPDECWEWQGYRVHKGDKLTYGVVWHEDRKQVAHRVAWKLANNAVIPKGMIIMHTCDNPPCCNPAHLRLGTHSLNQLDKFDKGRQSEHSTPCLPREAIMHIVNSSETNANLARQYNLSKGLISDIRQGRRYARVTGLVYDPKPKAPRRLSDDQAREIYLSTESAKVLAARYGMCLDTIYRIKRGERYADATEALRSCA